MTKKISIITINYNSGEGLKKTINSVINSNNLTDQIEYIVIDGLSTDDSLKFARQNTDYIDQIISEKDEGISDAFNKGVKLSCGEYVLFLNAGDELQTNIIPEILKKIDENRTIDIIHGNAICYNENKPMFRLKALDSEKFNLIHPFMCHQSMFCSRSLFEKYGLFNTDLKFAMDYEWYLKCYKSGIKIRPINIDIVKYSLGGTSDQNITKALKECRKVALENGFNSYKVSLYYFWKIKKALIQNLCNKIGIGNFILIIKSLYKSKYESINRSIKI